MSNKLPITVTIITRNEEERIEAALRSISSLVDEIIVIDSGSSDKTIDIAKKHGAKVFKNTWSGYGPQKRFAEDKATHNWILNLDADERVSQELTNEIRATFSKNESRAYRLKIHDKIYGTNELTTKPSYTPIRLYNKKSGRFSESPIHDRVHVEKNVTVETLSHMVIHDSVRSFEHRIDKLNAYSSEQANAMYTNGRPTNRMRLYFEFTLAFWRSYIFKGRIKLGTLGFIHSMNYAFSRFLRLAKLYELQHIKRKK